MSDHLIEALLPVREIHLLAGPTGAGKTRWLFQTILEWSAGLPVLSHRSYPVPWIYASADRSQESAKRTLESMKIDPTRIPFIAAWDTGMTLSRIIDTASISKAKLVIIESFGSFVEGPPTANNVKSFLQAASKTIRDADLTLLGIMEQPKMKPKERYGNPRQRISGVASWGHFTETIILVEPVPSRESCPLRTIHICPRNGPEMVINAEFRPDGRLHYLDPA